MAIVVALFKEELIRRLRHPKLTVKIYAKHPYIVRSPAIEGDWSGWEYFIRLQVENTGKVRADKVEVFLSEALIRQNGSYHELSNFTPMNLRWSYSDLHRPNIYADGISPEMGRLCDFGMISDPDKPTLPEKATLLSLWQEVLPRPTEGLRPGRYKFKLEVAASNCEPKTYWIDLHLKGLWNTDPTIMMSNGIVLGIRED